MTDQLLPVILSLDGSARSIDATFATAGGQLGEILSMFEATHIRLGTVADELAAGSGMDRLQDAMLAVAGDLRTFSGGLSVEADRLHAIAVQGEAASRAFRRLTERIGFVAAVARCARIESARFQSGQDGPSFFGTIGDLVALARQSIQDCVEGHARLKALLASAIATQTAFAATYGTRLTALADDLERSLGRIEDSQRSGTRLAADAALQSRVIADSISAAIVALQCGDSTRQRLEHALATLRTARTMAGGDCAFAAGLAETDRALLQRVLHSLVATQLRDMAATMRLDVEETDAALRLLGDGMAACQGVGRSLDDDGRASESPLATFEAELACASDLLGKCNAAQAQVDHVTHALTAFVDQFSQTTRSLSRTVSDIVLLGMNARLHASRTGAQGSVLIAIAQELKSVADEIVEDAAQLSPTLLRMGELVSSTQARTSGGSDGLGQLDSTMRGLLATMTDKRAELAATLERLASDCDTHAARVMDARTAFAAASTAAAAIDGAAGMLDDRAAALPGTAGRIEAEAIEAFLDENVFQLYTMAVERKLHAATLAAHGLRSAEPETTQPSATDALEAIFAF